MQLKIRERLANCKRILAITKKPSWDDLKYSARICAMGIALVGAIGFVVYVVSMLFIG